MYLCLEEMESEREKGREGESLAVVRLPLYYHSFYCISGGGDGVGGSATAAAAAIVAIFAAFSDFDVPVVDNVAVARLGAAFVFVPLLRDFGTWC